MLDTNAYSALMRGHREVVARVREAERILISPVVIAELLFGFRLGNRWEENSARLAAFLASPFVERVGICEITADRFARLAVDLREKGRPIPTHDLWIAAQVSQTGCDLLSSDGHFGEIDGLAWIPFSPSDEDTVRERVRRYHAGEAEPGEQSG